MSLDLFPASYGATSPCIQRGRFAVIPEEPSGSPSVIEAAAEKINRRTPSPDWDFTIEVNMQFISIALTCFTTLYVLESRTQI